MVSRGFFPWYLLTEPCALRLTQPLKVSTRDFSWGKGGRCAWLATYHPCSAQTSRKSGALTYSEPLGTPRSVAGHLHFTLLYFTAGQEDRLGDKNCALLGYYAASIGNFLPTFRDNPLVPYSSVKNPKRENPKVILDP